MRQRFYLTAWTMIMVVVVFASSSVVAQQPAQQSKDGECAIPAYTGKDLDQKPKILDKPEPNFSSEDRRDYYRRVITLRALLCGSGTVTNIKVTEGLSDDLNVKAIEAARKIKFIPAENGGNRVSRFIFLKYFVR
jgi:Gram-negative bacterial TonB protein C-terminal